MHTYANIQYHTIIVPFWSQHFPNTVFVYIYNTYNIIQHISYISTYIVLPVFRIYIYIVIITNIIIIIIWYICMYYTCPASIYKRRDQFPRRRPCGSSWGIAPSPPKCPNASLVALVALAFHAFHVAVAGGGGTFIGSLIWDIWDI